VSAVENSHKSNAIVDRFVEEYVFTNRELPQTLAILSRSLSHEWLFCQQAQFLFNSIDHPVGGSNAILGNV
jgi:hypothetical protein